MLRKYLSIAFLLLWSTSLFAQATGPTYFYVVTAVDANGMESAFSNQATATFGQGQKTITLTWVAPTVPTGNAALVLYNVYRSKTTGGPYTKINSVQVPSVTYADSFVLPNAPSGLAAVPSN